MQHATRYAEIKTSTPPYWTLLSALIVLAALGLAAAHHMDVEGHQVTGMDNQIVWGLPHVFAIFLIVSASGALNLASLSSVFGRDAYKPLARFSAVLSIALLSGGLAILLLDLGRPDRLIVAMTHYNFKSIFAWNIILYIGFILLVLAYLWVVMERRMQRWIRPAAWLALLWRLVLTSGTGLIFGFLAAREAYDSALLAPMFIVMSFAFGMAIAILLLLASCALDRRVLADAHLSRWRRLLGLLTLAVFYFVIVFHLTRLYAGDSASFERFILFDGDTYPGLFWFGQVGIGYLAPLALLYLPQFNQSRTALVCACAAIVAGALAQLYVIIIGGQAWPLDIFPGYRVESSFADGVINDYAPSLWESLLGLGGVAAALLLALLALRVLPILPEILAEDRD